MMKSSKKSTTKSKDTSQPLAIDVTMLVDALHKFKMNRGVSESLEDFAFRVYGDRFSKETILAAVERYESKLKKKSYYKPIRGEKKLSKNAKKRQGHYTRAVSLERELLAYLAYIHQGNPNCKFFRSPGSKTPCDVWWMDGPPEGGTFVRCYQCKSTKDIEPPRIVKKNFNDLIEFCVGINAEAYWVDRWKKNKNVYIRRWRRIDLLTRKFDGYELTDFSYALKKKKEIISQPDP